jgi:hypothetical protein
MLANSNGSSGRDNIVGDRTYSNIVGGASSNQNSSSGQKQPSLLTNVQYNISGATSTILLGKSILTRGLANDFIAGGDVAEITEAAAQLNEIAAPIKILGNALGVISAIEHGNNLISDYNRDGLWSSGVAINTGKLLLVGVFIFVKSSDPIFIGAAIAYGVTDYLTNDR